MNGLQKSNSDEPWILRFEHETRKRKDAAGLGQGGKGCTSTHKMGDELCSVCEEYIAEWFCRKCARKICQVHLTIPRTIACRTHKSNRAQKHTLVHTERLEREQSDIEISILDVE